MNDIVKKNGTSLPTITPQDIEARMIVLRKQPVLIDADVAKDQRGESGCAKQPQ